MMQVLEQAIKATGGLDQAKLADYMHKTTFDTFVGKVRFGQERRMGQAADDDGAVPRHQAATTSSSSSKPASRVVLYPGLRESGELKVPYTGSKKTLARRGAGPPPRRPR